MVELAVSLAMAVGAGGGACAAIDVPAVIAETTGVAQGANCRTVDTAIVAYAAEHDAEPRTVIDLRAYVSADISAYQLVDGRVTGPGCAT
jgi:hypothetical protein